MSGWTGDKSRWGWNAAPDPFGSNACPCRCVPVAACKNAGTLVSFGGRLPISKVDLRVSNFLAFDLPLFTLVCNSLVELWIRVKSHITLNLSQLSAEAQQSEITTGVCFSDFFGISNILLPSSIWDFLQVALLSLPQCKGKGYKVAPMTTVSINLKKQLWL